VPSAVNSAEKYETFRARHQVGTKVKGAVESYASHGVYVRIGDVAGYLPLRLMTDPAPRTPREHVRTGQALSLAVSGYNDARRSIEVSLMPVDRAVVMKAVTRAGTRNAAKTAPKPVVKQTAKQAAKQAAKPATKLPSRVAKAVARAKRAPRRHST
jgi:transcriptional accessory protein Tex/SPT6